MTRPRTGQRKLATAPVRSPVEPVAFGSSLAGVTTRTLAAGWADATWAGAGARGFTAAVATGGCGAGWVLAWAALFCGAGWTPGMVSFCPTRTTELLSMWFALAISARDLP